MWQTQRLLGMLMKGNGGDDMGTRQEAMYLLGRHVFGSPVLDREEKCRSLQLTVRRILAICQAESESGLHFYYRAAMLGRLYRLWWSRSCCAGAYPFHRLGLWPSFPAPLTPLPCPTRVLSGPSGTGL